MTEGKSLSVIVSEILVKLNNIEGMVRNTENNMKIMLSQVNKLSGQINNLPTLSPGIQAPTTLIKPKLPPGPMVSQRGSVTLPDEPGPPIPSSYSFQDDDLEEEILHKGHRRDVRHPAAPEASNKTAVEQKVMFPDGRTVAFAQVEIKNNKGIVVKQTRTTPSGYWKALLDPGTYEIHLLKRGGAGTKLPVELRYNIDVIPSEETQELSSPDMPEIYSQ